MRGTHFIERAPVGIFFLTCPQQELNLWRRAPAYRWYFSTFSAREGSDLWQDVPLVAPSGLEQNKDRATVGESLACKAPKTDLACDLEFQPGTVMM